MKNLLWYLTGVDRTPRWWSVWSLSSASGHRLGGVGDRAIGLHAATSGLGTTRLVILYPRKRWQLVVVDQRLRFESEDTWTPPCDRMLGIARPIDLTSVSGCREEAGSESPPTLFRGGAYLSPMARSSSHL